MIASLRAPPESSNGLSKAIAELGPWFHNLHLPDGTQTAPNHVLGDFPSFKWKQLSSCIPQDLTGWSVLDIGCNAGFYCIELARRNARVTGIDKDPHFLRQAQWAIHQFGLEDRITLKQQQVYDVGREMADFDLIMFMGVFYHLRHPLLALDILARRVRRFFVFQTLTMPGEEVCGKILDQDIHDRSAMLEPGWPKMAFIEHSLAGDPTNWWAPNHSCVEAMLRSTGLQVIARPGHEIYLCEPIQNFLSTLESWELEELVSASGGWKAGTDHAQKISPQVQHATRSL